MEMEKLDSKAEKSLFCAFECDWLPPDLEEIKESRCYEADDWMEMDSSRWKCRWERAVWYCRNCPNYEMIVKFFPCDKCKREGFDPMHAIRSNNSG